MGEHSTGAAAVGSSTGMLEDPKDVPCLSCPLSPLEGQFGGHLRVFYSSCCFDMLHMTSPFISVSYS